VGVFEADLTNSSGKWWDW